MPQQQSTTDEEKEQKSRCQELFSSPWAEEEEEEVCFGHMSTLFKPTIEQLFRRDMRWKKKVPHLSALKREYES